jgi:ribosomal peptide maturation radical SAM protein 1
MDVIFVVMPFADIGRPAIGVSLLKAAARNAGYTAAVEYCNVAFVDVVGAELYGTISGALAPDLLVGEWVFADAVFGRDIPSGEEYLDRILGPATSNDLVAKTQRAREHVPDYVDACVEQIMARRPRIVGFTTTFHQTCASLAVARRIKTLPDPPLVVFGGANCEGEMGLQMLQSFDWIDAVCCGEADLSFPRLLETVLRGAPGPLDGVLTRDGPAEVPRSAAIRNLDELPYPDYDDYFAALEASVESREAAVHVVVETSRGCWWGVKHHCTFCGLNGDTMTFRSKSADRAFDEITALAQKHNLQKVGCVDNILDMRYIDTLFPRLAESGLELELFYEVKANLRYDQLVKMRRGGMRQIQPGIESFSNDVLRLMDKGVSGTQNIQLMRWCRELGIDCAWNVLAGFPGEAESEYERMAELIPLLEHLDPPMSCARLRLDRFSPFHARPHDFGFMRVRPARAYFFVFPLGRRELGRLAYFFDYDYDDARNPEAYLEPVQLAVGEWWRRRLADERPRLEAEADGEILVITDTRTVATAPRHLLEGVAAALYEACDVATSLNGLLRRSELAAHADEVEAALESLLADRLMLADEGRYLSLAVFRTRSPRSGGREAGANVEAAATS